MSYALLVAVVVIGGFWLQRTLDQAKEERCQLAFGQIKLLQVELLALEPYVQVPPDQKASIKAQVADAVQWVTQECGPIPT